MYTLGLVLGTLLKLQIVLKTALQNKVYSIFCEIQCAPKIIVNFFVVPTTFNTPEPRPLKKGTLDSNAAINSEGSWDMSSTQYNQI